MARTPKLRHAFLWISFFLLSSCGKYDRIDDGGFTTVEIGGGQSHNLLTANVLTYGILIYAYSDTYVTNLKLSDESQLAHITLPNGTYQFYAFGHAFDFGSFASNPIRCAVSGSIALTGTAQTVALDFRESNCANGAFTSGGNHLDTNTGSTIANSGAIFAQLEYIHCGTAAGTALSTVAATQDCSTGSGISAPWAVGSNARFQAVVPIFKRSGNVTQVIGEAYRSACSGSAYVDTMGSQATSLPVRFPSGVSTQPGVFPIAFETFTETDCNSVPVARHEFYNGLIFGPTNGASLGRALYYTSGSGVGRLRLYLREP